MNPIPFIRLIGSLIVGGLAFWFFGTMMQSLAPYMTQSIYYTVIHMIFSFSIGIILVNIITNFFIEVRGRDIL